MSHSPALRESDAISVYRYGRALLIFIGAVAAVFFAVAAFVFYLSSTFSPHTLNEKSVIKVKNINLGTHSAQTVLDGTIGLLIVSAICLLAMAWLLARQRKGHFELHPAGVVRQFGNERSYTPFDEIQDLYMFAGGRMAFSGLINNFAYRTGPQKEWVAANSGLKKFEEFMAAFRELHVVHRMPLLQHDIAAGHRVTFRYVDTAQIYWKRFAGGFLRVKTRELSLSNKGLHVGDDTWPYAQLQQIEESAWSERVMVKNVAGDVVFSCIAAGMLSADVFFALLDQQLRRQ